MSCGCVEIMLLDQPLVTYSASRGQCRIRTWFQIKRQRTWFSSCLLLINFDSFVELEHDFLSLRLFQWHNLWQQLSSALNPFKPTWKCLPHCKTPQAAVIGSTCTTNVSNAYDCLKPTNQFCIFVHKCSFIISLSIKRSRFSPLY